MQPPVYLIDDTDLMWTLLTARMFDTFRIFLTCRNFHRHRQLFGRRMHLLVQNRMKGIVCACALWEGRYDVSFPTRALRSNVPFGIRHASGFQTQKTRMKQLRLQARVLHDQMRAIEMKASVLCELGCHVTRLWASLGKELLIVHGQLKSLMSMYAYVSSWMDGSEWRNKFGLGRGCYLHLGHCISSMDRESLETFGSYLMSLVVMEQGRLTERSGRRSVRIGETKLRATRNLYELEVHMCMARERSVV